MYKRKNIDESILFDLILIENEKTKKSPSKILKNRLFLKTGLKNEKDLLETLRETAIATFGDYPGHIQDSIWLTLR